MRRRLPEDHAAATVIGAIIVLAILGLSIAYVNGIHVPRQGLALETEARADAAAALETLALRASSATGPESVNLPLRAERPLPPLLSGVVLAPARAEGSLLLDTDAARVTISHVTDMPPGGVAAGDPMRVPLGNGKVRVYDIGNATHGMPMGALAASVGGAYAEPMTYLLEGGALIARREGGDTLLSPPALLVTPSGRSSYPMHHVAWRLPILHGEAAESVGAARAQVLLTPGPLASAGGRQLVHEVTITIDTAAPGAWRVALEDIVGSAGTVTADGEGRVSATILPPPETRGNRPTIELDLHASWVDVAFRARTSG